MTPFRNIAHRLQQSKKPTPSERATKVFLDLFREHGLSCQIREGWIVADSGCLSAQARVFPHTPNSTTFTVQLDLETKTPSGQAILESCTGIGLNLDDAVNDGIRNFCNGPFHVIYSALTGQTCSHCESEEWTVAGTTRRVIISPMVIRGQLREGQQPPHEWFEYITSQIQQSPMTEGMHWIRLFHADWPGGEPISEVLFDNEISPDWQQVLAQYPWPSTDEFYTVRVFLIILP